MPDLPVPTGALLLDAADHALVAAARATISAHYRPFWHTVAAALRGADGRIWTGVHLGATVGRLSICAEAVALGRAVLDGAEGITTAVAVRHPKPEEPEQDITVVAPCGACREMFVDHAPELLVIVPHGTTLVKLPLRMLLPLPYMR